jgi:hypothetical protein
MILTKEEKVDIINQHVKSLNFNKYNLELSIIEESSILSPNESLINSLELQVSDLNLKLDALKISLDSLI